MEAIKYAALATSKDNFRPNLCRIYRDKKHFVATDGHRLHRTNGLEETTPHFIDGFVGDFPDYERVFPKEIPLAIRSQSHTNDNKDLLARLKKMLALVKMYDHLHKQVVVSFKKGESLGLISFKKEGIDCCIWLPFHEGNENSIKVSCNLEYLLDAFQFGLESPIKLEFFGATKAIKISSVDSHYEAIVMPMRLPKKEKKS